MSMSTWYTTQQDELNQISDGTVRQRNGTVVEDAILMSVAVCSVTPFQFRSLAKVHDTQTTAKTWIFARSRFSIWTCRKGRQIWVC